MTVDELIEVFKEIPGDCEIVVCIENPYNEERLYSEMFVKEVAVSREGKQFFLGNYIARDSDLEYIKRWKEEDA